MVTGIDHVVITVSDIRKSAAFYRILGLQVRERGGRYEFYGNGLKINVHLQGHELNPHALHAMPGSADLCFEVSGGLEEEVDALKAHGFPPERSFVPRRGRRGPMTSCYFRDPDGNLIELCAYPQKEAERAEKLPK